MTLEQTDQAYRTFLEQEDLDPDYKHYLRHALARARRDPYEEALDLLHLQEDGFLSESLFNWIASVFLSYTMENPSAWNDLGALYYLGKNGICDFSRARECYEKGEAAGDLNSIQNLGFLYRYGQGIKADQYKAWYCFSRAAFAGLMPSMLQCAWMMEQGIPFEKDLYGAFRFYQRLVEEGDPEEEFSISIAALLGMGRLLENPDLDLESWIDAKTCYQSALDMVDGIITEENDPLLFEQLRQAQEALKHSVSTSMPSA